MKIGDFCFDFLDILFFFMKTRIIKDNTPILSLSENICYF